MSSVPVLLATAALTLNVPATLKARATPKPSMTDRKLSDRRHIIAGSAAALAMLSLPKDLLAYDSVPKIETTFAEQEALRKKREAMQAKNRAEIKPYLTALAEAKDANTFGAAADNLSLWIIGKGTLPSGIDAAAVRDAINDAYEALPRRAYRCEKTRDNDGVCFRPGPPADDAYMACLKELRKYATRKGKGSLMSDGVSAANSAAF